MYNNKNHPNSSEAECAVLSCIMIDNECWSIANGIISSKHFYNIKNKIIFLAMSNLIKKNEPIDLITLEEYLKKNKKLNDAGGKKYLELIYKSPSSPKNITAYSKIVKNNFMLRSLIKISKLIIDDALNSENKNIDKIIESAEQNILSINENYNKKNIGNPKELNHVMTKTIQRIESMFHSESDIVGIASGFKKLDKVTSGFQRGELSIIAARPSMGKTALAINMIENIVRKYSDSIVIMFSMEMPAEQIVTRLLASTSKIDLSILKNGKFRDEDWPKLSYATSFLSDKKIFIDDSGDLTPFDMKNKIRRVFHKFGKLSAIFVDYLQLMRIPNFNDNRVNEISEISRSLKALSKEFNVPVIALSQLNRGLEQRNDKRPIMSDIRESGAIEQDADLILFIYRDEVYNAESKDKGTAEIIIAKQRNGPIGRFKLTFIKHYSKFENFNSEF